MRTIRTQRGMTGIGWMMVIALIAFFSLIGMRLFPLYTEFFSVKTSMESLKNQPDVAFQSKANIMGLLLRRFDINDVERATHKDVDIDVKGHGLVEVSIAYEARSKIAGNVDVIVNFEHVVELDSN